ncbi:MAG: class 1 fructose-bisphosphatase [Chloroflexi bacterium]|nr:class 1 fructose-bisphosphatase [Chloroflexota bacterium]MCI0644274.1 class 1 fructose-bisphosphatase [Chloroflexota bacterium]MCI0726257.1 class 1 fructose-bisphosphatase [Chloroflexota bacterium]
MRKIVTIERFILDNQPAHARGDFTNLLYDIALAAKVIAHQTTRAGLVDILGRAGSVNIQGEQQMKLDVFADDVIFRLCDHTGRLCVMASEEREDIIPIPQEFSKGRYVLVYDPLDGSSNIDVNVSIGTIFSIYRCREWETRGRLEDCLQKGRDLVAAGYILYGSSTMLVYSTGAGVHGFTLDPDVGEFLLSHPDIMIPEPPRYYSVNHSYFGRWTTGVQKYVRWLQGLDDSDVSPLSERYIGSLVADFHRNLLRGGVFLYPAEANKLTGKLRLLYEAAPLGFLVEQAGGYASDGRGPILDIEPVGLHQRVPMFVGNRSLVEKAEAFIREYDMAKEEG